jgi:PRONE (Plant-specific Rop nucleotide exchanger)
LNALLQDILDSSHATEFWYADQKKQSFDNTSAFHRSEEKWWVPVPCLPENGLPERARKELQQKRDCANQIHKAAMAINNDILSEMEVPDSYITTLPKVHCSLPEIISGGQQTPSSYKLVSHLEKQKQKLKKNMNIEIIVLSVV